MGDGTCQKDCPANFSDVVCSPETSGCKCEVGFTCQNSLCRPAKLFCVHAHTKVLKFHNNGTEEFVTLDELEVGDNIQDF